MKLPRFETSEDVVSLGNGQFYSTSMSHESMQGVEMNGIFDSIWDGIKSVGGALGNVLGGAVSKIPCVLSKAGSRGVSCLTQCGPNPACLASCAGPTVLNSIMECL